MAALNANDNFDSVCNWLDENLSDAKSFKPHLDEIPKINSKGIYFWFMSQKAYKGISNIVAVEKIEHRYTRTINGEKFDLVYLGTAGNGKKGKSNLFERLKWHTNQKHSKSSVCAGTLSTLRTGLGVLLSNDLIIHNTEQSVNAFMKNYFRTYWLEYKNNKSLIDSDESYLINNLKPLLNLDKNPNSLKIAPNNPTKVYKNRRKVITNNTKIRLGCGLVGTNSILNSNITNLPPKKPVLAGEKLSANIIQCITFEVLHNQNICDVAEAILNLPKGKCSIEIFDSSNKQSIYPPVRSIRTEGRTVSDYFSAPDTKNGNTPKWKLIQSLMIQNKVKKITVKVCPILSLRELSKIETNKKLQLSNNKNDQTKPSFNNHPKVKHAIELEKITISENFKIVMMCSAKKKERGELIFLDKKCNFLGQSNHIKNEFLPDDLIPKQNLTWREWILQNQNKIMFEAYNLYTNNTYINLFNSFNDRLYILSAGWGLVNANFKLPKYDITFSGTANFNNKRKFKSRQPLFLDFNQLNVKAPDDIIFIGVIDYLPLFFNMTQDLPNRKIIYYFGLGAALPKLPNDTFQYRKYNDCQNQHTWFYQLGNDFANGLIP